VHARQATDKDTWPETSGPALGGTQHWIARNRLEGDSPRVLVDLHCRFAIDVDRIRELVFA
jgi:hypothetical protein